MSVSQKGAAPTTTSTKENATSATMVSSGNGVLLQTAKASVSPCNDLTNVRTVRILLDGGSPRSYATTQLQQQLNMGPVRHELLTINASGGDSNTSQVRDVISLNIFCTDGSTISVECLCVPTICSPIHNQHPVMSAQEHGVFDSIVFADDCSGVATIDVLLGADTYWQIVTGELIRSSGPTAISTRIGWVLSGPTSTIAETCTSVHVATVAMGCTTPETIEDPQKELLCAVQQFWKLESLGIIPTERNLYTDDST